MDDNYTLADFRPLTDAEFDALHGGRELLPIEQAIYEAEGAERFAKFHGHGRTFPNAAGNFKESA